MAYFPCDECKYGTLRKEGFRAFVGCSNREKEKGFVRDNFTYKHSCTNFEQREYLGICGKCASRSVCGNKDFERKECGFKALYEPCGVEVKE